MVHEALAVANQLQKDGYEIEVVDLRTVKPLDTNTVLASVARTGRLLCVGEAFPWGGVTAEVIARVATRRFPSARCRARAHQRERHTDPLPPESVERTSPEREDNRGESAPSSRGIIFMPQVPITMPQLGESMAEATIVAIKVKPGEKVSADQEIIEVETDKAVMGVTTPCAGEIAKIDAEVKGTYAVGAVLGYVEASEADAARFQKTRAAPPTGDVAEEIPGREENDEGGASAKRKRLAFPSRRNRAAAGRSRLASRIKLAVCRFPRAQKAPVIFRRAFARACSSLA